MGVVLVVGVEVGVVVCVSVSVVVAVVVGVVTSHAANEPSLNAVTAAFRISSCSSQPELVLAANSLSATHCTRPPGSSPGAAAGPKAYSLIAALNALAVEVQNAAATSAVISEA